MGRAWDFLLGDPAARADAQIRPAVMDVRLPWTLAALLVGICLGAAGCLLQAATRNPLAETGLLGVNSGAAFAVVRGLTFFGADSPGAMPVGVLAGGMAASAVVLATPHRSWCRGAAGPRNGRDALRLPHRRAVGAASGQADSRSRNAVSLFVVRSICCSTVSDSSNRPPGAGVFLPRTYSEQSRSVQR